MYLLKDYKEKSEYNLIAHAWLPAWVKKVEEAPYVIIQN